MQYKTYLLGCSLALAFGAGYGIALAADPDGAKLSSAAESRPAAQAEWLTDLPQAEAKARAEDKLVLIEFTGSDWCPPCIALHQNVFSRPEFADYARKNLVLVVVDFPQRIPQSEDVQKTNQALATRFSAEAFPTVIVLDRAGKELMRRNGYGGQSVRDFISEIEKSKK